MTDEAALFLGDILASGYFGAELCEICPGDTVAVLGAGPVGLCAMTVSYTHLDVYKRQAIYSASGKEMQAYENVYYRSMIGDYCIREGELDQVY